MGFKNHLTSLGGPTLYAPLAWPTSSIIATAQLDVLLTHDAALHAALHHLTVVKAFKGSLGVFECR